MNKYEEEFRILQYRCTLCGCCFPYEEGKEPQCPHCGKTNKAYIELRHDAGYKEERNG